MLLLGITLVALPACDSSGANDNEEQQKEESFPDPPGRPSGAASSSLGELRGMLYTPEVMHLHTSKDITILTASSTTHNSQLASAHRSAVVAARRDWGTALMKRVRRVAADGEGRQHAAVLDGQPGVVKQPHVNVARSRGSCHDIALRATV